MLAALKSERVVDMSDMEMQLEAAPQENREGRPYLGSVAFYKHVILFFVFLFVCIADRNRHFLFCTLFIS